MVHIPPILVDRQRQNATHPEKNDSLDALGVGKVIIAEAIDKHPTYSITEKSKKARQLREVVSERDAFVREKNQSKE